MHRTGGRGEGLARGDSRKKAAGIKKIESGKFDANDVLADLLLERRGHDGWERAGRMPPVVQRTL